MNPRGSPVSRFSSPLKEEPLYRKPGRPPLGLELEMRGGFTGNAANMPASRSGVCCHLGDGLLLLITCSPKSPKNYPLFAALGPKGEVVDYLLWFRGSSNLMPRHAGATAKSTCGEGWGA